MKRVSQIALVAVIGILLLGATGDPGRRFDDLGHRLMCRCGCNQVLLECNHVGCQYSDKMRAELKALLAGINPDGGGSGGASAGSSKPTVSPASDQEILDWFVQKYGATVLAAPTTTGFNLVAWIMPFAALALGTVVAAWIVRLWKRRRKSEPVVATVITSDRVEELRERARQETEI